jgi:hypothetical protein
MEVENYYSVLLYSKYSEFSKNIIKNIENSGFDFVNKKKLSTVCIDNDDIRNRILNSNNMDIKVVPCILVIHDDGIVEKYEGDDAFKWVDEIITKNIALQQTQQILQTQPTQLTQQSQVVQPTQQSQAIQYQQIPQQVQNQPQQPQYKPASQPAPAQFQEQAPPQFQEQAPPQFQEEIDHQFQEQIETKNYVQKPQPQPQFQQNRRMPPQREIPEKRTQPVKKNSQEVQEPQLTSIDDLSSGEEDLYDNIENNDIFPPKQVSLRSGAGTYELNTDFGKKAETKITRGIKATGESTGRKGKADVMSAALEMQKLREKEGDVIPKPTFA